MRVAVGLTAGGALALTGLRSGHWSVFAQDATPGAGVDAYPEVAYTAVEYSFTGPVEFASGLTRISLTNNGTMDHHAMLFKLNDGKSVADLAAAFEQGLPGLFAIGASIGGPGSIGPGRTATVIQDVAAGNYIMMCLIPDTDGIPHVAKGMALPITVTAGAEASTAPAPQAQGTIELTDFHFAGLPESLPAGQHLWEVKNNGQQLHELVVYRQASGVTFEQVQAILMAEATPATPMAGMDESTPMATEAPPFEAVTGWAPANPGMSGWVVADLEAGDYFAICFVPDSATGAPHFALGMIQPFIVA